MRVMAGSPPPWGGISRFSLDRRINKVDPLIKKGWDQVNAALKVFLDLTRPGQPFEGWTNKFLFPPHEFSVANRMITNFHLPYSTLLMMVAAFGGYDFVMEAYQKAIKEEYRFGTYGDAMLII